jgi:hypothetical protein
MLWARFGVRNSSGRLFLASPTELGIPADLANHITISQFPGNKNFGDELDRDPDPMYMVLWHYG